MCYLSIDTATKTGLFALFGSLVGGIFALLGGWISVWMQRKTEHQKWLREKRADVFAELLRTLTKCQEKAAYYLREHTDQEKKEKKMYIGRDLLDIYYPVFDIVKIVRLFTNKKDGEDIEKTVRSIYALHTSYNYGDKRHIKITEALERLQKILEDNLKNLKWP